jgi:hypothetical protein
MPWSLRSFFMNAYQAYITLYAPKYHWLYLFLQNYYPWLFIAVICVTVALLLKFQTARSQLFLLPFLIAIHIMISVSFSIVYFPYMLTVGVIFFSNILSFLFRPRHRQRLSRLRKTVAILFFCYAFYEVILLQEPLTDFIITNTVPHKLCPDGHLYNDSTFDTYYQDYIQLHNEILNKSYDQQRFLIFQTNEDGLGNRLEGLVSSFLMAMLTKRAFILDWHPQLVCQARWHELFESPGFKWDYWPWPDNRINQTEIYKVWIPYCRFCPVRRPDYRPWNGLLCDKDFGMPDTRVWLIKSTQWFAPVLAHNPHYRPQVCHMLGSDIAGRLIRRLLRPIPELRKRIEDFKALHFDPVNGVIGLHIRGLEGNAISKEREEVFWRCAAQLSRNEKTKWFLATDRIQSRQKLLEEIGDRLLFVNSTYDRGHLSGNGSFSVSERNHSTPSMRICLLQGFKTHS